MMSDFKHGEPKHRYHSICNFYLENRNIMQDSLIRSKSMREFFLHRKVAFFTTAMCNYYVKLIKFKWSNDQGNSLKWLLDAAFTSSYEMSVRPSVRFLISPSIRSVLPFLNCRKRVKMLGNDSSSFRKRYWLTNWLNSVEASLPEWTCYHTLF